MIYHPTISALLIIIEIVCALVALYYLFKLKKSYWKWFSIYLIFIAIQEVFWYFQGIFSFNIKQDYYGFFGIPIQYLFLFWLYAFKSLKRKKLFYLSSTIYLLSYVPFEIFYKKIEVVYSINLTIGVMLLSILIVLEFIKQIKNDDILNFKKNKMFYINFGVILSYIGSYPFWAFYNILEQKEYLKIWNIYYLYFLIASCIMYLLFTVSFIWGKSNS